ncbi:MAG: hypothetical protein JXL81_03790, partial [Deltaproteobacteria bacterium]|nr:hypothetical protein [Deltaproteobacteria bacterium]
MTPKSMAGDIYHAGPSPELTFGWELVLDLYNCNIRTISDEAAIKNFAGKLCEVIDMKPYGEPLTPYFG